MTVLAPKKTVLKAGYIFQMWTSFYNFGVPFPESDAPSDSTVMSTFVVGKCDGSGAQRTCTTYPLSLKLGNRDLWQIQSS
jgi:hypothetical protein